MIGRAHHISSVSCDVSVIHEIVGDMWCHDGVGEHSLLWSG